MNSNSFARTILLTIFSLTIITLAPTAFADELPQRVLVNQEFRAMRTHAAKAGGDTINLMASHNNPTNEPGEPAYYGDFEDGGGNPAWNGWTSEDLTRPTVSHWNVSNYNQPDELNHAAWCGDINIPSCTELDPVGGYGNYWHDLIEFRQAVPNPGSSSTVTVTATMIMDTEPGYDYVHLSFRYHGQPYLDMEVWDGTGTIAVSSGVSYIPPEYVDGTDIAIYFRFKSDSGWSDEDCYVQSAGACQIDDINVNLVNGSFTGDYFEDFEHGGDPADFGIWNVGFPDGVGDFAHIWTGLEDNDPCFGNSTPQVAFVDDDVVVPGTGGSDCINWCYGPGGYIVTTTGGLAGPTEHINNVIISPAMVWPDPKMPGGTDYDGISVQFSVYIHEDLSADSPGVFATYSVRSADTDGSAGNGVQVLEDQPWLGVVGYWYGSPSYYQVDHDITDLMEPGRDEVQLRMEVVEGGYIWNWVGNDGYPAPYWDNISVKIFPYLGPGSAGVSTAQDNFPSRGTLDLGDLASHSVRFDRANNIAYPEEMRNDPGDSLVFNVVSVRAGAELVAMPEMHYNIRRNPVFDPYRTDGLPAVGSVVGQPAVGLNGLPTPDMYAFDLPDTGFFFPGDVIHYYFTATDAIGGAGGADPQTLTVPADTTGFSTGFGVRGGYNSYLTTNALPSIREDGAGGHEQPGILMIDDGGGGNEWNTALNNIGLVWGEDYDEYFVNTPGSGLGNGIGGRANHLLLSGYEDILYTSGSAHVMTISNGDFNNDPGNDVAALRDWIDLGNKDIYLEGDGLATDLSQSGTETLNLLEGYMGLTVVAPDVRPLINNQTTPKVKAVSGNPVFNGTLETWLAYGGCRYINTFDAVEVTGTGQRIAEFLSPYGFTGMYRFSAATLNIANPGPTQSRVVSMPVALEFIYTDPESPGHSLADRTRLLENVLNFFGVAGDPFEVTPVLPEIAFAASNHPNPFNPSTTIMYSMPRAGHLKLSVYNVRGHLVKTLVDGLRPAGADQSIVWDGTDNQGSAAGSGLYFYEARTGGEVKVGKMTLVK